MSTPTADELAQSLPGEGLRTLYHQQLLSDGWGKGGMCKHRGGPDDIGPCPENVKKAGSCSSPVSVREDYNNVGISSDADIMLLLQAGVDPHFVAFFTAADIFDAELIAYVGENVFNSKRSSTADMRRDSSWYGLGEGRHVGRDRVLLDDLDRYQDAGLTNNIEEFAMMLEGRLSVGLCELMRDRGFSVAEMLEFADGLVDTPEATVSFSHASIPGFVEEYAKLRTMCSGVNSSTASKIAMQEISAATVTEVSELLQVHPQKAYDLLMSCGIATVRAAIAVEIDDFDTLVEFLDTYGQGYVSDQVVRVLCETFNRTGGELVALAKNDPFYRSNLAEHIEFANAVRLRVKKTVRECAKHGIKNDLQLIRAGIISEKLDFFLDLLRGSDPVDIDALRNLGEALEVAGLPVTHFRDTDGVLAGALRPVLRRWEELRETLANSSAAAVSTALIMAADRWEDGMNVSYTWFRNNLKLV